MHTKEEVCHHCGQALLKAEEQRNIIQNTQLKNEDKVEEALNERQDKLDLASQNLLEIIERIEKKVGADLDTLQDVKELEDRIRAKIKVEDKINKLTKHMEIISEQIN